MRRGTKAKLRRKELDRLFKRAKLADLTPPRRGWIADIREAIGMTGAELARRLRIDASSAKRLEDSEAKRSITLSSLDRAAEALGCRVAYILIPNEPLEEKVRAQAEKVARRLRKPVAHSMALEDQATDRQSAQDREELFVEELIFNLDRALWEQEDEER
ncbi:MAG: mobile mystery protein A [Acidobacteria bacterium]|nr:mobile mystery protein A [Acidobacteriota bacterium]